MYHNNNNNNNNKYNNNKFNNNKFNNNNKPQLIIIALCKIKVNMNNLINSFD